MGESERDQTGDWVLPAEARPATMAQLEQRIDHALAVARASEAAALEIGAAALDAAAQARRAAELAELANERASSGEAATVAVERDGSGGTAELAAVGDELEGRDAAAAPDAEQAPNASAPQGEYDSFKAFLERADRISARLEAIAPVK